MWKHFTRSYLVPHPKLRCQKASECKCWNSHSGPEATNKTISHLFVYGSICGCLCGVCNNLWSSSNRGSHFVGLREKRNETFGRLKNLQSKRNWLILSLCHRIYLLRFVSFFFLFMLIGVCFPQFFSLCFYLIWYSKHRLCLWLSMRGNEKSAMLELLPTFRCKMTSWYVAYIKATHTNLWQYMPTYSKVFCGFSIQNIVVVVLLQQRNFENNF